MSVRTLKKLRGWIDRIETALDNRDTGDLPNACRWYLYWLNKLRREDLEAYAREEARAKRLLDDAANLLNAENRDLLLTAIEHREGSKSRINALYRYIYTYQKYIHPCSWRR